VAVTLVCVFTNVLMLLVLGGLVFDVHNFPEWAAQAALKRQLGN
jgi:hypothetical protein